MSGAEDFADGSIAFGRYVLYNGGKYEELRLNGEVFGGSRQVRGVRNAV